MSGLDTLLAVVELVQGVVTIYKRIDGLPQQMIQLGRRLERLNIYLVRLNAFVSEKPQKASRLYSGQKEDLKTLLDGIKSNTHKVKELFERYEKGIISEKHNLEFRIKWASQIWFSLVENSPEKVQSIMEDIEYDRSVLSDYLSLMALERKPTLPINTTPTTPTIKTPAPAASKDNKTTAVTKRPSPSPSPLPQKKDYKILFVDPYHAERTAVAEALLKLLGQLTLRAKGDWRIAEISSAGFFVKKDSDKDVINAIDSLDYSYKSFKKPWKSGESGTTPKSVALQAVFDNKWAEFPFKTAIYQEISARTARGLTKDMFKRYEYIIVFTGREHDNMIKLKEALTTKGVLSRGNKMGRILQLGTYLAPSKGGQAKEIYYPMTKDKGVMVGSQNRAEWNKKVAEIKTALKEFLREEMRWKMPDKKTEEKDKNLKAKT